jgi:hypothetical protein
MVSASVIGRRGAAAGGDSGAENPKGLVFWRVSSWSHYAVPAVAVGWRICEKVMRMADRAVPAA